MTDSYYDEHADDFFARTKDADLAELRQRFLSHLPSGGRILDAGCGSGRDALAFVRAGYRVTAFDASPALARLACEHTGLDVLTMRFKYVTWSDRFDGVWACASLLHVPRPDLPAAVARLARSLVSGGVLYASFKEGDGEREDEERRFTDLTTETLGGLLGKAPGLELIETWRTQSALSGRHEVWVNGLASREPD